MKPASCTLPPDLWGPSRDTLQWTGRALTSCSDGTHLRGEGDPRRPASTDVTAALHFGYGLWHLVRTAPVCQSRVTVSWANVWEKKETHTHTSLRSNWLQHSAARHFCVSHLGSGSRNGHSCPLEGKLRAPLRNNAPTETPSWAHTLCPCELVHLAQGPHSSPKVGTNDYNHMCHRKRETKKTTAVTVNYYKDRSLYWRETVLSLVSNDFIRAPLGKYWYKSILKQH